MLGPVIARRLLGVSITSGADGFASVVITTCKLILTGGQLPTSQDRYTVAGAQGRAATPCRRASNAIVYAEPVWLLLDLGSMIWDR